MGRLLRTYSRFHRVLEFCGCEFRTGVRYMIHVIKPTSTNQGCHRCAYSTSLSLSGYSCHILVLVSLNLFCGVATLFWVARPDVSAWPLLFWHYFECHKFSEAGRKVLHPGPKNLILTTDLYSFLSTLLSDFSNRPAEGDATQRSEEKYTIIISLYVKIHWHMFDKFVNMHT